MPKGSSRVFCLRAHNYCGDNTRFTLGWVLLAAAGSAPLASGVISTKFSVCKFFLPQNRMFVLQGFCGDAEIGGR